MQQPPKQKISLQTKVYEADPEIERAIDDAIAREKEIHTSDVEPFEHKSKKLRESLSKEFYNFKKCFDSGYRTLMNELSILYAESLDEDNPLAPFEVDDAQLEVLKDKETCVSRMQEGQVLADILGFSQETLTKFYQAATSLLGKNQLDEARDSYYFLATLAPNYPLFWLGLGYTYALLNEHNQAVNACELALQLDPIHADGYLIYIRVFLQFSEHDNALEVTKRAIAYANEHKNEPWAADLVAMMQEAVAYIQTNKG